MASAQIPLPVYAANPKGQDFAMLFDATRCIGCKACQVACKQWNDLPGEETTNKGTYENPLFLTADTWLKMHFTEGVQGEEIFWHFTRNSCMHCTSAPCVGSCPTGAIAPRPGGVVLIDDRQCIGCRACVQACPWDAVHMDKKTGVVKKCTLCYDRINNGLEPACVQSCPTDALLFGSYQEMRAHAERRVEELKARGYPRANLYGDQAGGTHVMYVLREHPSAYGLPTAVKGQRAKTVEKWSFGALAAAALSLLGFRWLSERRVALQKDKEDEA